MWPHLFETIREATEGEKAPCTIQSFVGVIVGAPCHTACRSLLPQVLMRLRLPPPSPPFPIVLYGVFGEMGAGYQNRSLKDLSIEQPATVRSAY